MRLSPTHKPVALLTVPILSACGGPLSTLAPSGPAAQQIATLWWVMLAGSAAITLLVGVLVAMAMRRPGMRDHDAETHDPALQERRARLWIRGWGLIFTLSVLTALLAFALFTGERMLARDDGTPRVSAEARQWEWRFTQPGPDGLPVRTRGALYVPAGQPFDIAITAEDVIHSFWVPQLGGKMDAIPGHENLHRLRADRPGIYEGLCAEFCGLGHSGMRFVVVAYDPAGPLPEFVDARDGLLPDDARSTQEVRP